MAIPERCIGSATPPRDTQVTHVAVRFPQYNNRWSNKRYVYFFNRAVNPGDWVLTRGTAVRVVATNGYSLNNESKLFPSENCKATANAQRLATGEEICKAMVKYKIEL